MRSAGNLGIAMHLDAQGARLESVFDLEQQRELCATNPLPLFELRLRHSGTHSEQRLTSDQGWQQIKLQKTRRGFVAQWHDPAGPALKEIGVTATASADPAQHAWRWKLRVENNNPQWSVGRVIFPQLALADLGTNGAVLFPRGPGEVQKNLWSRDFKYQGNYPGGWCAMQFLAAYGEGENGAGLYLGVHDPWGGTKDIAVHCHSASRSVRLWFDHPAPDMGKAGNDFELSKETNGQPVRLAAMCPTSPLWQQQVRDIVLKLLKEVGTRSVLLTTAPLALTAQAQSNLVYNGDFERDSSQAPPAGWAMWGAQQWKISSHFTRDTAQAHAGKAGFRIHHPKGTRGYVVTAPEHAIQPKGKLVYAVSFWARADAPVHTRFGFTAYEDVQPFRDAPTPGVWPINVGTGWMQYTFPVQEGLDFDFNPGNPGLFFSISRRTSEVIVSRIARTQP